MSVMVIATELWWMNQEWLELRWGRTIDQKWPQCKAALCLHPFVLCGHLHKCGLSSSRAHCILRWKDKSKAVMLSAIQAQREWGCVLSVTQENSTDLGRKQKITENLINSHTQNPTSLQLSVFSTGIYRILVALTSASAWVLAAKVSVILLSNPL
jgi:hypothetical protein